MLVRQAVLNLRSYNDSGIMLMLTRKFENARPILHFSSP